METEIPVFSNGIQVEMGSPSASSDSDACEADYNDVVQQAFSSISVDPGLWTVPIIDVQRHDIVQSSPTHSLNNSEEVFILKTLF